MVHELRAAFCAALDRLSEKKGRGQDALATVGETPALRDFYRLRHASVCFPAQAQLREHHFQNLCMGLRRRAARVDHDYALWVAASDGEVAVADPSEEGAALLLEAVFVFVTVGVLCGLLVAAAGALDARGHVGIHEQGEVGLEVAAQDAVEVEGGFATEFAAGTLVGLGGVGEAVAEDDFALGESGFDDFADVLGAGGEHEGHLGHGREAGGGRVEDDVADLFAGRRAPGFAGDCDREAPGAEGFGQFFDLGALAGAVQTLEGDELAAMGVGGHWGMIRLGIAWGYLTWSEIEKQIPPPLPPPRLRSASE